MTKKYMNITEMEAFGLLYGNIQDFANAAILMEGVISRYRLNPDSNDKVPRTDGRTHHEMWGSLKAVSHFNLVIALELLLKFLLGLNGKAVSQVHELITLHDDLPRAVQQELEANFQKIRQGLSGGFELLAFITVPPTETVTEPPPSLNRKLDTLRDFLEYFDEDARLWLMRYAYELVEQHEWRYYMTDLMLFTELIGRVTENIEPYIAPEDGTEHKGTGTGEQEIQSGKEDDVTLTVQITVDKKGNSMSLEKQLMPEFQEKLKDACEWLGIRQGRAAEYVPLLDDTGQERRSEEQIMAYYESRDIVALFELWRDRVDAFPGLKDKLRRVCEKGPVLSDDERNGSTKNRPRNDAFGYLVAGKFLAAGIPVVSVDGIASGEVASESNADLTFRWGDIYFNVECKRLQSEARLLERAKEAGKQITQSGRRGIIVMDCSAIRRPTGTLLDNSDPDDAGERLFAWLQTYVAPKITSSLSPDVFGFILFVGIPAMTYTGKILAPSGKRYQRRDVISTWLIVADPQHKDFEMLKRIGKMLNAQDLA